MRDGWTGRGQQLRRLRKDSVSVASDGTVFHENNAVADLERFFEIVDEYDCRAILRSRSDRLDDIVAGADIDPLKRLIEQQ